ncbi:hypothetical protein BHM03_00041408 [Ensete ventricosum]|nr:hypothetical protein BHM03_00041408 [Ensete ventricosum]
MGSLPRLGLPPVGVAGYSDDHLWPRAPVGAAAYGPGGRVQPRRHSPTAMLPIGSASYEHDAHGGDACGHGACSQG